MISTDLSMDRAKRARGERSGQVRETVPGLRPWKLKDSADMTPDKGFTKQLKAYDPELEVVWNSIMCVWEIWRFPKAFGKDPFHMMTVQTEGRSYRELGADILLKLRENDPWRFSSTKAICDYLDEMDNQILRRKRRDFKNKIEAIALDTFDYARAVPKVQVPRKFKIERAING